jgi:hypothetical protein
MDIKKITMLLRARESEEQLAVRDLSKVVKVLDERTAAWNEVRIEREKLEKKEEENKKKAKEYALQGKSVDEIQGLLTFAESLGKKIEELKKLEAVKEKDSKQAQVRAAHAEEDLLLARVEKKKVEVLLEQKMQEERVRKYAEDEDAQEELSQRKRTI